MHSLAGVVCLIFKVLPSPEQHHGRYRDRFGGLTNDFDRKKMQMIVLSCILYMTSAGAGSSIAHRQIFFFFFFVVSSEQLCAFLFFNETEEVNASTSLLKRLYGRVFSYELRLFQRPNLVALSDILT